MWNSFLTYFLRDCINRLNRWLYTIMQQFGHKQIRSPDIISKIKNICFPKCNLSHVELSGFVSVQNIDLSSNDVRDIIGLETLTK